MKIVVIGAGEIGKHTLIALSKILPKDQKINIVLLNRDLVKAGASKKDVEFGKEKVFFCLELRAPEPI
ncbi:MAG: hypothetical protein V4612_06515 [Pseudomonadota bacterium]